MLIKERPRLTAALDHLRTFSNTATGLINDTQADLVRNLKNLEPTIKGLADVGPDLDLALAAATVFPFTQNFVDRAVRGDYFNLHVDLDLTIPKLKGGLFLGTHWGQLDEQLIPAPGDPFYLQYTLDPLHDRRRTAARSPGAAACRSATRPSAAGACSAEPPVQRSATGTRCSTAGVWPASRARGRTARPGSGWAESRTAAGDPAGGGGG